LITWRARRRVVLPVFETYQFCILGAARKVVKRPHENSFAAQSGSLKQRTKQLPFQEVMPRRRRAASNRYVITLNIAACAVVTDYTGRSIEGEYK
jgi:hypothetical protein